MSKEPEVEFSTRFRIGRRFVGAGEPVYVIAEAGVAHFGRFDWAVALLELARDAGADAFKLQVFDAACLIADSAAAWRDRLRSRVLSFAEVRDLRERCDRAGLDFILTAHDASRTAWLRDLDVAAVKVGSGERNNPQFLSDLAALRKPMIVSTGMHTEQDVREALAACQAGGCRDVCLLHCVTSYPTPPEQVNLRAMDRLSEMFPGPVGYSDHTADHLAVYAAAARGARIIEKHITLVRDIPDAQDWRVSAGPEDFGMLVKQIRSIEQILGHGRKEPSPCEAPATEWALKSLVAVADLPAGHRLTAEDLVAKRPGDGLSPNRLSEVLGRCLRRTLARDEKIRIEDLQ